MIFCWRCVSTMQRTLPVGRLFAIGRYVCLCFNKDVGTKAILSSLAFFSLAGGSVRVWGSVLFFIIVYHTCLALPPDSQEIVKTLYTLRFQMCRHPTRSQFALPPGVGL